MYREIFASQLAQTTSSVDRIRITVSWILERFDDFYREFRNVPPLAKHAFERRDHATSIWLSRYRLSLYSKSVHKIGLFLKSVLPEVSAEETIWDRIEEKYLDSISNRYEADLTFAYLHSIRRIIYRGEWRPVEYSFGEIEDSSEAYPDELIRKYSVADNRSAHIFEDILLLPGLSTKFIDITRDAELIRDRINDTFPQYSSPNIHTIEMIETGFYRNRGAYIVGRITTTNGNRYPLIIALLNNEQGIFVDALLLSERDAHNLFSSTLANFHVDTDYYHELSSFLYSIMPNRAHSLHYSTIGYNHVGKVAVIKELKEELETNNGVFDTAIGFRGTVAIGFSGPSSAYNLKVIRNHPTDGYKWGNFEGIESVMEKYSQVHEINRTGSMLDNIIYFNIALEKNLFSPSLLEELLVDASETVSLQDNAIVFKYLIVQPRLTPLPVFLETASEEDAKTVVINLGDCIKNNAAANIFNKDLDSRNYGVSHFLKVYLYDYDALEPFVDVKIRTNLDQFSGEEDIPDWFFENGVVFLPEEMESGLRIKDRELCILFRQTHGDLTTTAYWEDLQQDLLKRQVPTIKVYPDSCKFF